MSNELDTLSSGEIQPFNSGSLQERPFAPELDTWGRTDLDEYQRAPQTHGRTLFGEPTNATPGELEAMLGQLGGAFMSDFSQLGYPQHMVKAAIDFMNTHALKTPYQVRPQHNFNLHGQDDWLGHAFGNMVQGLSGSPRAKQQFVTAAITWLAKATAKLSQPEGSRAAQGSAPNSTETQLSQLSDADYARVVAINNKAQLDTLNTLTAKHGQYSTQNMIALAQAHLEKLTPIERAHFDQFTTDWVHMMNCVETIEFLYSASIGSASLPKDGVGIAKEIAEFEAMLKVPSERARYFKDPQLQSRYRTLLDMQQGG